MNQKKRNLLFVISSILLVGLDQWTKVLARIHLKDGPELNYLGDTVTLHYVENTGAFLGLGTDWPDWLSLVVFSILPSIFLVIFFVVMLRKSVKYTNLQMICFTLFVSGGVGNIIDRIAFHRHVTDFMLLGKNYSLHTGIFNVADMYVSAAAIILVVLYLKQAISGKGKKPEAQGS
jgi:signal peptidase II